MITIYSALYREAQELILAFQLKKEPAQRHFQVFSGEAAAIRVVITGAGAVAAATAVAEISTCYPPEKSDLLLNFGSCGGGEAYEPGRVYLCHKITELCSGRTFYPDVLYRHPFAEAPLASAPEVVSPEEMRKQDSLIDMEAVAIYQAGNYYYSPHQMIFIKVVTDHGAAQERRTMLDFQAHLQAAGAKLCVYVETLRNLCTAENRSEAAQRVVRQQAKADSEKLAEELKCSVTMAAELSQLLFYCRLTGREYDKMTEEYRRLGRLPVRDKREGKKLLEELKTGLL